MRVAKPPSPLAGYLYYIIFIDDMKYTNTFLITILLLIDILGGDFKDLSGLNGVKLCLFVIYYVLFFRQLLSGRKEK